MGFGEPRLVDAAARQLAKLPFYHSFSHKSNGDLTYLVTERGLPSVKEGFGNWFSDVCRRPECAALTTACGSLARPARPITGLPSGS